MPAALGTTATLGGGVAATEAAPGLRVAWSGAGIALLEVTAPATGAAVRDDLAAARERAARRSLVGAVGPSSSGCWSCPGAGCGGGPTRG